MQGPTMNPDEGKGKVPPKPINEILPPPPPGPTPPAGKPKFNWLITLLLPVILGGFIGGCFTYYYAPSKVGLDDFKSGVQATIGNYNDSFTAIRTSVQEQAMRVDSIVNGAYVTDATLNARLGNFLLTTTFTSFQDQINARLNTSPAVLGNLSLNTTYDGTNLVFGITKAGNTTAYFMIEGTVYYDTTPPATPTPTPMLAGFNKTFSTLGMDQFSMTTYGKTEIGGSKGYAFTAPVGKWYYTFEIIPLMIGGNVSGGSSW